MARQFRNLTAQVEEKLVTELFNNKERFYYKFYLEKDSPKTKDLIRGLMSAYLEVGGVKSDRFKKTIRQILREEVEYNKY